MPMIFVALLTACILLLIAAAWMAIYAANRLIHPRRSLVMGTPSKYGLAYEEASFLSSDGITLCGWFIPATNPRGTVIFCHGYAGNRVPDLQYAPAFHKHGYNVLLFDFRAHGQSSGQKTSIVCHERQDLLAATAYLQQRGISQIGLMGFSMGAAVAIATAPLHEAVRAVIADSGFAELRTVISIHMQKRGIPKWLASLLTTLTLWAAGRRLGCHLSDADPLRSVHRLAPRPLLIIHGGQDEDVPVSEAYRLYKAAGEIKELWIVPKAEQRCVDQLCPEEYNARVLSFFDKWL